MGWLEYPATFYKNGKIDRKAECDNEFNNNKFEVLKSCMVSTVYYAAVRYKKNGTVFCVVGLTHVRNGNILTKFITEDAGPGEYKCPKSILKLLSSTTNVHVNTWRKKCEEYHDNQASPKSFKNMQPNTEVLWTVPVQNLFPSTFNSGETIRLVKYRKPSGRYAWYCPAINATISPKYISESDYHLL